MTAVLRLLTLMLLLLPLLSRADSLSLPSDWNPVLPGPYMQVWKDPEGLAEFAEVRELPETAWQPVARRDASFGYGSGAYWLRLDVHNPHARSLGWLLVVGNPLLDRLDAYGLDGEKIYRAGDQRPFNWRWIDHRQLLLPLELAPGETRRLWLRMQTDGSANLSASLMTHEAFDHQEQRSLLLQGLFFGALAAMFFYNLSIYGITRDRNYLWYSLFVASFTLYQFIQLGFALQWLWPQALAWHQLSFPLSSAVATLFGIFFTYGVLELRRAPPLYTWICGALLGGSGVVIVLALFAPYQIALIGSFVLLGVCAAVASVFTLLRWRAGYRAARLFALGWSVLIVASLFSVLSGTGLLPYSHFTLHAQQIGGLIEMAVFSVALATRIRQAQNAERQAQLQLVVQERRLREEQAKRLDLQTQINDNLALRINDRTAALEQALQKLSDANLKLAELNRRDGLTGLFNRQTLNEELERARARSERGRHPLAILMMDLDFFKQVNDRYGHLGGDACLRHAATRIQQRLRSSDLLARFGGEEFAALLSDTDRAGALSLAEQLRDDLARTPCIYEGQSIRLTLSIGLYVDIPTSETSSDELLERADQALYRAKKAGRNRVEVYEATALDDA